MSVQSLFLKEVTDYETANTKLPTETAEWDEAIIGKFLQKIPSAESYIMKPKYTHISEETGTAMGSLYVVEQAKRKLVAIPLVIKRFQMYPLDVIMSPNKDGSFSTFPLTTEKFNQLIVNSDTFDYLDKTIDRMQELYFNPQSTTVFPPYLRNVASSGVLDFVANTITPAQKNAFFEELEANKNVIIGYEKRANLEILQKIAEVEYDPEKKDDYKDPKLMHLKVKGDGDLLITTLDDEMYDPIISAGRIPSDSDDPMHCHLPEDALHAVIENGERIISNIDPVTGVSLYHNKTMLGPNQSRTAYGNADGDVIPASSFSHFKVQDSLGIYHRGVVFPNVIDFKGKPVSMKIFYNTNCYSYQSDFAGMLIGNVFRGMLQFGEPSYGMVGTFISIKEDATVATIPVLIKGRAEYNNGKEALKAIDAFGKPVKINLGYPGSEMVEIKGEYYLPCDYKFLPMSNFKELAERPDQIKQKVSAQMMDATPIKLMHTGHGQFSLRGPDIDKMASLINWDHTNLSPGETAFLLSAKRCPMETIRESIKTASFYPDGVTIHGLPRTSYTRDSVLPKMRITPVSFLKEASYIDDAETVDALLSLNFMSTENIHKFCAMIPILEHTGEKLAQLLLASRIGMSKIPEGATSTAMYKLIEVIEGLKKLKLQDGGDDAISA